MRGRDRSGVVLGLVILVLTGALAAQGPAKDPATDPEVIGAQRLFSAWAEGQLRFRGYPGMAVGVVSDQRLVWSRGFGLANLASKEGMTPQTKFRMASHSKLFTATAIMQLREQGKLRLDDPVSKHLSWFTVKPADPDDPPITPIAGVSRIMRTIPNYKRLLEMVPSPMNTITLCQGNFTLMTDDLPREIRSFGKAISFVHFRDVRGVPTKFEETWHDDGKTDMLACMKAYRDIGFDGVLRPDHVPTVEGDSNTNAGYSAFGRLYAIGYIRGLREAVYGDLIQ